MDIEREIITPEIAAEMLGKNLPYNRPINDSTVDKYAADMKAGRWCEDTADAISISEKGYLLDGQHRLTAIVKSGQTMCLLVARDVKESAFEYMDNGKQREAWQFMEGPQTKNRQAMAKFLCSLDKEHSISRSARGTVILTRQEILAYEREHCDEIFDAVSAGLRMREHVGVGSNLAYGGAIAIFHRLYGIDMTQIDARYLNGCKNSLLFVKAISRAYISAKSKPNTSWVLGTALQFLEAERNGKVVRSFNKQDAMIEKYSDAYGKLGLRANESAPEAR